MKIAGIPEAATWQIFDEAFAQASAPQSNANVSADSAPNATTMDRPAAWQLEMLQLEASMLRAAPEQRSILATQSCERILELCLATPQIDAIWNQGAQLMRRWNRTEAAQQLSERYLEVRPDSIPAVIAQAERETKKGDLPGARQRLLDRLQSSPGEDSLLQAILLLSDSPADQAVTLESLLLWCGADAQRLKRLGSIAVELPIVESDQDLSELSRLRKCIDRWLAPRIDLENKLRNTEGMEGSEWRALTARRLLAQSQVDLTLGLEELDGIINSLKINRPLWATTHVLDGMLSERRLEPQTAIKAFQRALALGEESPEVLERVIQLMRSEGMVAEARQIVESLSERGIQSRTIAAAAMELAFQDRDRLMELAKIGIESRPKDPMAWVWYAQVLDAQTRLLNAQERSESMPAIEEALQRAEQLSEGREVRVYNAMYEYFTATGQTSKVEELLERIRASNALPPSVQWLFLAIAQHADGNLDLADSYYRIAIRNGGDPREIGPMLSKLLLQQGKVDACIEELDKLLRNDPKDARTRESIAIALALRGLKSDWERLIKLLTDPQNANNPEDRRTLSKLFVQRGLSSDIENAQTILENLVLDPRQRTDEDSLRLASIYTTQAKALQDTPQNSSEKKRLMDLADVQLQQVTTSSNAKSEHLVTYGNFLLGQGRAGDAEDLSIRLALQAPKSADAMLLRSRVAAATNKNPEKAIQLIQSWAQTQIDSLPKNSSPALRNQILAQASNALFAVDAAKEADPWLDTLLQQDSPLLLKLLFTMCQSPEPHIQRPAFDRFLEIFAANPKRELAFRVLQLLSNNRFAGDSLNEAERLLVQFQTDHPEDPEYPIYLADYWIARKQWDQAIAALRTGVKLDPKNVFALNNLANLLGERPEGTDEALQVIDQAIAAGGKQPNLLDSKGSILIQAGRFADACKVLEEAATLGFDPRIILHWYMALRGAGQIPQADSLKPKIDLRALRGMLLSPADQAALEELSR
jgi:tetratricopeptide (TPR) repeat protein